MTARDAVRPFAVASTLVIVACGGGGGSTASDASTQTNAKNVPTSDAGDAGDARPVVDGSGAPDGSRDAAHDAPAVTSTHETGQTITVNGEARTYDVSLPAVCDATHLHPLVFVFHGDGGKGSDMYGAGFPLEAAAASAGGQAIFVYPDGTNANQNGSAWDIYDDPGMFPYAPPAAGASSGNLDVDLFDAMVAYFESKSCADPKHVFLTGMSNGGYESNQLARWRSSVVAATAPQSGGPPAGSVNPSNDYAPPNYCVGATGPVPVLILHGSADTVVTPDNCQQAASYWDMANGCANNAADCSATTNSLLVPPATPTTPASPSPCVTSTGCTAGYPVILCEIPGMGHQIWSQAPATIWAFFASH